MHSVRSAKTYYFAAFLLGSLIAFLVVSPAHSAESLKPAPNHSEIYGALQ
jgi:hypothetical protein